ncbi:MAG: peroxiredoxin [Desulfurococcales archaeon]|jgi:peroxiredoxin (alkyl hydroperoxide reductase subunit C)|uniref:Peroxiredoxin n=1 Tax=Fervidicoccus fontis TaxID=683846 RepID=A0A7J3SMY0_9CREN|nr:peroxiredoxin [Desulfurococcales archaeon]
MPRVGEKAPSFEAQTTYGKIKFPDDFKGKWVILFSHPADFTPVCTTEFFAFQKRMKQFEELGVKLIGLSVDQVFSHIKWDEWIKEKLGLEITFPIIADNTGKIATLYGMLHAQSQGTQAVRATFIIDPDGIIRAILYYPMELGRNMDEIIRMVKALQLADREKVAIPANWPNNEIMGNKVIVPPPTNKNDIPERLKNYECLDWWLCYKSV